MKHPTLIVWCVALAHITIWGPTADAAEKAEHAASARTQKSERQPAPKATRSDVEKAENTVDRLTSRSDLIQRWLRSARMRHLQLRARCLDQKLSQAHAVERTGQRALAVMRASVKSGETSIVEVQMARLEVFEEHSRRLLEQAGTCGKTTSKTHHGYTVKLERPRLPSGGAYAPRRDPRLLVRGR